MKLSYFLPALIAAQGAFDMCECKLDCALEKCVEYEDDTDMGHAKRAICYPIPSSGCADCKANCVAECKAKQTAGQAKKVGLAKKKAEASQKPREKGTKPKPKGKKQSGWQKNSSK